MSNRFQSHEVAGRSTDAPHALSGLANSTRARMFVAILSLAALDGCATVSTVTGIGKTPQQRGSEAYTAGNYREALQYYSNLDPKKLSETEKSQLKEIEAAVSSMVLYYADQAKAMISNRRIEWNNYNRALEYYRQALDLYPVNHTSRKSIMEEISKIENSLKEFDKQYNESQVELDKLLTLSTLSVESIDAIYALFYKMQKLRVALRLNDKTLYEKAMGKAKRLLAEGNIAWAFEFCKIAKEVDFSEGEIIKTTQVTHDDMELFARMKVMNEKDTERRRVKVEHLSQLAFVAFGEKKMDEVRRLIGEVQKLETKSFKAANQLASKINSMSRSGRRSSKKPVVVAASNGLPSAEAVNPTSANEGGEDIEEIRLALENLVSQFNSGDKFEAIAGLENVIEELSGSPNMSLLIKQRNAWNADRSRLASEIQEKADKLFMEEDPEALSAYRNLLKLNPSEEIRKQAVARIKTLENILGK